MKTIFLLVPFGLVSISMAKPTFIEIPRLAYATLVPGAPVGPDGRVIDTPEVALAKAEHAAAQRNERVNLANEAARSSEPEVGPASTISPTASSQNQIGQVLVTQNGGLARLLTTQGLSSASLTLGAPLTLASLIPGGTGAPIGSDGRIIDAASTTALVNIEDPTAQINEQLSLANEASRASGFITIASSPALALRL